MCCNQQRRKKIRVFLGILKDLMNRTFVSESHALNWKDFNRILEVRSIISMGGHCFLGALLTLSGGENYHQSEKFLEEEGPANIDLAREILPTLKVLTWVLSALRLILFVASLKYNRLSQYFIYLWLAFETVESFMPDKISMQKAVAFQSIESLLLFLQGYFNFWPAAIATVVSIIPTFVSYYIFFNESVVDLVVSFLIQAIVLII